MINSTLRGKRRTRDLTGETYGPYVVLGPVGADWRTTECWRLGCPICGHQVKVGNRELNSVRYRETCGGCLKHARMCPKVGAEQ